MNKENIKKKLPLFTFILELVLVVVALVITLYEYHQLLGGGALSSLLGQSSPDDAVTGWLVFPAMIVDFFGVLGYIFIVVAAIIYFGLAMLVMSWNMWMVKQNKDNKLWIKAAGILPSGLLAFKVIKEVIPIPISYGGILMYIYTLPAVIVLIESIIYTTLINREPLK